MSATTSKPVANGIAFTCGGCGHVWVEERYQIVFDPCAKCGQYVSSITRYRESKRRAS
jgi:uncharacterized protein (DUF983 family)